MRRQHIDSQIKSAHYIGPAWAEAARALSHGPLCEHKISSGLREEILAMQVGDVLRWRYPDERAAHNARVLANSVGRQSGRRISVSAQKEPGMLHIKRWE